MKYQKGMKRYTKAGGSYKEDPAGSFYKGSDGKMYRMPPQAARGGGGGGENGNGDDDDDEGGARKSDLTEADLLKTLSEIEDLYKAEDPMERRNQLLQKAQEGDLTAEEHEELLRSLRGETGDDGDATFTESLTKGFAENEGLQKALDVSEYLDEQHGELVKALDIIGERIEATDRRQHDFNLILAKAVHQVGTLVKGMSERLGIIEAQPARAPKSMGVRVPAAQAALEKSFPGADGTPPRTPGESLSKGEILDVMTEMMEHHNGTAPCGEDILQATAKYEQTGQMSKAMANDVIAFHRENAH